MRLTIHCDNDDNMIAYYSIHIVKYCYSLVCCFVCLYVVFHTVVHVVVYIVVFDVRPVIHDNSGSSRQQQFMGAQ